MQKQFILIFMHSIEYEYGPKTSILNWPTNISRNRPCELRNGEEFFIPRCSKESLRNAPLFNFPSQWNALDINIKLERNPTSSKSTLISSLVEEINSENVETVNADKHSH
jgi:hypothetical protein